MGRESKRSKEVTRRPTGGPVINEERAQQRRSSTRNRAQPQQQTSTQKKGKGKAVARRQASSSDDSDEEEEVPINPPIEPHLFTCKENEDWYNENIGMKMVVELPISAEVENSLQVSNVFDTLGWRSIASIRGDYDASIIVEFYANLQKTFDYKSTDPTLVSYLRGAEVYISPGDIARAMDTSSLGFPVIVTKQPKVVHDKAFNFDIARESIDIDMEYYGASGKMSVNRLDVLARVCAHLFNFNMLPRASCYNELRNSDLYLLSRLFGVGQENYEEVRLSWPHTVCHNVMEARFHKRRSMVFPITLYKALLNKYGKDLGELNLSVQVDEFNAKKMEMLGFHFHAGQWQRRLGGEPIRRNVRRRVEEHEGDAQQGEAQDYSNQALMQQLTQQGLLMESMSQQLRSLNLGNDRNEERLRQIVTRHEVLDTRTLQIIEQQRAMAEEQRHMREYMMQYGYKPYDGAGPSDHHP